MKKNSKDGNNQMEKDLMMNEENEPKPINSDLNIKHNKQNQGLSLIAQMKYRIEEMNKKLFEKRNQRK